jgi:hypothetical protein
MSAFVLRGNIPQRHLDVRFGGIHDWAEPVVNPAMSAVPPKAEVNSEHWWLWDDLLRLDGAARAVIQAPKPEPRIMRYELNGYEWTAIKPMLPNKLRGVRANESTP